MQVSSVTENASVKANTQNRLRSRHEAGHHGCRDIYSEVKRSLLRAGNEQK